MNGHAGVQGPGGRRAEPEEHGRAVAGGPGSWLRPVAYVRVMLVVVAALILVKVLA